MVPIDWWALAGEWEAWRAVNGSGVASADRRRFLEGRRRPAVADDRRSGSRAEPPSVATLARAEAARRFVEQLVRQARLADAAKVSQAPLTFVAALGRLERYSSATVDELLPRMQDRQAMSGAELRHHEQLAKQAAVEAHRERLRPSNDGARENPGRHAGPAELRGPDDDRIRVRPLDGFGLRAATAEFADRVIAALSAPGCELAGGKPGRVGRGLLDAPLAIDALVAVPAKGGKVFRGFRAYPAAATDLDQKRLSFILCHGMFASRIFDAYFAVFEVERDAAALARRLAPFGRTGFGVAWLRPASELLVLRDATRESPPDLVSLLLERLGAPLPA